MLYQDHEVHNSGIMIDVMSGVIVVHHKNSNIPLL